MVPTTIGIGIGVVFDGQGGGGAPDLLPLIRAMFGGGEQGVIYDATDPVTLFQQRTGASATTPSGANGPIGSLKDLSPNNNWATANSDAARPLSRQGVGAPNVYAETDGIDDLLSSAFAANAPTTRVVSFRIIAGAGGTDVVGGTGTNMLLLQNPANVLNSFSGGVLGPIAAANGEDLVVTQKFTGLATSAIAKNNVAYITGTAGGGLSVIGECLGGRDGGSAHSRIRLYRHIRINRILTDPEIALCRTWVGAAAGLVL